MEWVCEKCRFWVDGRKELYDEEGECRRHAPSPSMDGQMIGAMLSEIATTLFDQASFQRNEEPDDETLKRFLIETNRHENARYAEWPTTCASDWCGDFIAKEEPV